MKKELEKISKNSPAENVYDFKAIVLKNEIAKIHNKLQMLSKGTSPDDNTA